MRVVSRLAVAMLLVLAAASSRAQTGHQAAPIERRAPAAPQQSNRPGQGTPGRLAPGRPGKNQQHLSQWMDTHNGMPLAQQQTALENEPGFRNLKPAEQDRMHARLQQLNQMPPEQRQRVIQRTEAMERLAPTQRQQIRGATAQLGSLQPPRRRAVASAFHSALEMPVGERQRWLNSAQVRSQFNDEERSTLNNLLLVAPAASQAGLPGFSTHAPPQ